MIAVEIEAGIAVAAVEVRLRAASLYLLDGMEND